MRKGSLYNKIYNDKQFYKMDKSRKEKNVLSTDFSIVTASSAVRQLKRDWYRNAERRKKKRTKREGYNQ